MQAWQIVSDKGIDHLELTTRAQPEPNVGQVRVNVKATALNFRDLLTVTDPVSRKLPYPRIPNSDGAGVVTAVGPNVKNFKVGDHVMGCFFQNWLDGPCTQEAMNSALGGALDGMLATEVCLNEAGIVQKPSHLSFVEAATLPCAALTAWNALTEAGQLKAGQTVLLLGTGGVSIFALQFAKMMSARVIIISSSDEKLSRAAKMGADICINYVDNPEWHEQVLHETNQEGVDLTVEVGGAGTLERSLLATKVGGTIGLIGVLTEGAINPNIILRKSIRINGIYVGSRRMFLDMNKALVLAGIHPVIDHVVPFEQAPHAFHALKSARHFGKIVIEIPQDS